jgi:small ligand-binding sensory domain FIST
MESQTLACRIGAGLSTLESAWEGATEAAREARGGARGRVEVDLAFLFLSPAHLDEAEAAAEAVREELAPRHLLGCVAEGVVAGVRELEEGPAVAVWAGVLSGAEIECFHVGAVQREDGIAVAGVPVLDDPGLVLLLVDPRTFPAEPFLTRLNEAHERVPLVGGIAAGGRRPGAQALILDDAVHSEGAVGAVVSGLPVLTVVSQGCRPVGHEAVITRCDGNVVYELAGRRALERLRGEIAALSFEEQALAARGLLVGLVIDENRPEDDTGDFLMRGLLGADNATGALALGATRCGSARPCASSCATRPRRTQTSGRRPAARSAMPGRPGRCSSPATAAGRTCSPSRTTTRASSPSCSGLRPSPASSAAARLARSAARPSCTGSRPPWLSSSSPEDRTSEGATGARARFVNELRTGERSRETPHR